MNTYGLYCCFCEFSLRNNYVKIMNTFLDLFYNHVHNLTPLTDFTKLDTHLARTGQIKFWFVSVMFYFMWVLILYGATIHFTLLKSIKVIFPLYILCL